MSRRSSNAEFKAITWLFVLGVPLLIINEVAELIGWVSIVIGLALAAGIYTFYTISQEKKKREYLMSKYNDVKLVEDIMSKSIWENQTAEQLLESIGKPEGIDEKVLKTKKKEIWKYEHRGGNRYGLRVTLDDDIVVGWDQKA